jgi:hypothetical protein
MEQIMILYHPCDDVYHCFCRMILLVSHLPLEEYELKKMQILDFYFLFPGMLKNIRFPRELKLYRSYVNSIKYPYSDISDPKQVVTHIGYQINNVVRYMAACELIDVRKIEKELILKINPEKYFSFIQKIEGYDNELLDFIVTVLSRIPLNGENGLKARTNLFEHRYDYG